MTDYHIPNTDPSPISEAARAAKAKQKKEWIENGAIVHGSTLKERYQRK